MDGNIYTTKSAKETKDVAKNFAKRLSPGDSVLLEGELGSGKTTFVQGLADLLQIKQRITSPTFTLLRSYDGELNGSKIKLHHIDLYRISDLNTVVDLGLSEIFEDPHGIVFIEWPPPRGLLLGGGKKSGRKSFSFNINFEVVNKNKRKIEIFKNE